MPRTVTLSPCVLSGGFLSLMSLVLLALSKYSLELVPNGMYDTLTIRHGKGFFLFQKIGSHCRHLRTTASRAGRIQAKTLTTAVARDNATPFSIVSLITETTRRTILHRDGRIQANFQRNKARYFNVAWARTIGRASEKQGLTG